jgi:stage III sporulation protein AA
MPPDVIENINKLCVARGASFKDVSEVRLSAESLSSVRINGENIALSVRVGFDELRNILKLACEMAVFAHRDDISHGFVPLKYGGRIGVCGHARYDGGKFVGVSSVSALIFRIPTGRCDFADKLYSLWRTRGYCGMLICSPAGVGKTTAIRRLAAMAGGKRCLKRVVVVDERCEFDPEDYRDCTVDILRGYSRKRGIEIAIRTMSAEILVVDEIGNDEDSEALVAAIGAGVSVLATAHGDDVCKVYNRPAIRRLVRASMFPCYAVITSKNAVRDIAVGDMSEVRENDTV